MEITKQKHSFLDNMTNLHNETHAMGTVMNEYANLFAASHEMKEALEDALIALKRIRADHLMNVNAEIQYCQMALAKAKGEQPTL